MIRVEIRIEVNIKVGIRVKTQKLIELELYNKLFSLLGKETWDLVTNLL